LKKFTVIAHRGASGYLPEHTLEGVAMAHAMGADYIEQDVVLTLDDELIVLHDLYLDAVTDVAERFQNRSREDGHHYAIDFTLEEIKTLSVHERSNPDGQARFPGRFPHRDAIFQIPTLSEEITLIQGLNRTRRKNVGIYIEPKSPAWHAVEGKDLVKQTVQTLADHGYRKREDRAYLQTFDTHYLEYARNVLKTDLKLVQLIGDDCWQESASDYTYLRTEKGLEATARLADAIGPSLLQVVNILDDKIADISDLVTLAHRFGLDVHAYTLRADQLPVKKLTLETAVHFLRDQAGLDGVFTDHPDQVVKAIR
jgi:glycerophosphoryl diester phosphodiesterase